MNSQTNPFQLNPHNTTSVFIDGPSLYWTHKVQNADGQLDLMKMRGFIDDNTRLQNISYYTVFPPMERRDENGNTPLKPLTDFLGYNGYRIFTKQARTYATPMGNRTKGSITIDLAMDAYKASINGCDNLLLFLSDEDYVPMIEAVQQEGTKVTLVSTVKQGTVSNDLVWAADNFIEFGDVVDLLGREYNRQFAA